MSANIEEIIARANHYRDYLNGHAYIPEQDRNKYHNAYKQVFVK